MATHALKTWPGPFEAIASGVKSYEIRKADRDYEVGDVLVLEEWDPATQEYTLRIAHRKVTYITRGGEWGLPAGLCVMSIERMVGP